VNLVEVEHLHHTYLPGTPFASTALADVTMQVREGEFLGLVGPSRSGKSTLIQFFNGLLVPQRGRVTVLGTEIGRKRSGVARLRRDVGLVFQYPEAQLFAESVAEDVAFGPRNFGLDRVEERVRDALQQVRLDPDVYGDREVSALSGGEKRRAAIAGVLASSPRLLVFDEPTAGIDPETRTGLLAWLADLKGQGVTVVVATNSTVEIAPVADRFVVLDEGRVVAEGAPVDVLDDERLTTETGIGVPVAFEVLRRLRGVGHPVPRVVPSPVEAADVIARLIGQRGPGGGG
jgi:energy-coupling factor transport system ATP-binding protein